MSDNFEPALGSSIFKKATDLPVGQSMIVYVTGAVESKLFPGKFDLQCYSTDKKDRFVLSTSGNLKYFAKDVADGKQPSNCLMKITRKETKPNKRGQAVTQFEVGIDRSKAFSAPETNEDIKF
jgi:hypothetical protein